MELWIRTQKKMSLIKVNAVNIFECDDFITIHGYINQDTHFWLANYDTKERALEVLDEIQHRLITLCDSMNRKLYVYEMPME